MRVFSKKRGYTIVEMMVVMAIIALLSVIGAFGMISARDGSRVEETSQGLLSTIRHAQNKTIAVEQRGETKAWGVKIAATPTASTTPGSYQMISYEYVEGQISLSLNTSETAKTPLCSGTGADCQSLSQIKITKYELDPPTDPQEILFVYIVYSTPFAKPYIITETGGCDEGNDCYWINPGNPALDWEPVTDITPNTFFSDFFLNPKRSIKIEMSYQNNKKVMWIKANGDVYLD